MLERFGGETHNPPKGLYPFCGLMQKGDCTFLNEGDSPPSQKREGGQPPSRETGTAPFEEVRMASGTQVRRIHLSLLVVTTLAAAALATVGCDNRASRMNKAGLEAYASGDFDKARAAFEEATQADPRAGEYYFNRGSAEQAIGHFDEAIVSYNIATSLKPSIYRAYANEAACFIAKKDLKKAEETLIKGTTTNPFTGEAFINLAEFYIGQNDLQSAKRWLSKGVAADPDNFRTHREYGFILAKTGEKEKAIAELHASLDLSPAQPDVSALLSELAPSGAQLPPPKPELK
jgi:tetratricopeptide (TPR) repeat protein